MKRLIPAAAAVLALAVFSAPAIASVASPGPGGEEESHRWHDEDEDHGDHPHQFTNRDLKGPYVCTAQEIHQLMNSPVEYCVFSGTFNFDGAGGILGIATMRCSLSGVSLLTQPMSYSVNPDGSFLTSDLPGMANPVHGEIVEQGQSLLLDGTTKTLSEILSWQGICMRR